MANVIFRFDNGEPVKVSTAVGENLLETARKANVAIDAPCSGTGVIRRHPDIKWLRREGDIANLTAIQAKILDSAFSKLKKGGILVYTTCSILPEENSEQIEAFLSRHPDAQLLPFNIFGHEGGTFQHLPGDDDADGFFYARMIKNS